jgi:soluble lytic murein transglycosylase-like protein
MIRIVLIMFFVTINAYADMNPRVDGDTVNWTSSKKISKQRNAIFDIKYDSIIEKYSQLKNIDPYIIKCIIKIESDFNPNAVSSAGAVGLMQLMKETAKDYGIEDRTDPDGNIRTGICHFAFLLNECKGDVALALAAYHAGLSRVKRRNAIPPIQATIDYVNAVMKLYTGKGDDYSSSVKNLYARVEKDGTLNITNK